MPDYEGTVSESTVVVACTDLTCLEQYMHPRPEVDWHGIDVREASPEDHTPTSLAANRRMPSVAVVPLVNFFLVGFGKESSLNTSCTMHKLNY